MSCHWTLLWVYLKGCFRCALFVATPLGKAALFGHPDYCQSERRPETPQLVLLRYEYKGYESQIREQMSGPEIS